MRRAEAATSFCDPAFYKSPPGSLQIDFLNYAGLRLLLARQITNFLHKNNLARHCSILKIKAILY
jgi:hypothetical protein